MKTARPASNPPDISVIWQGVEQIQKQAQANAEAIAALAAQLISAVAHIDGRFDQLESEINPAFPPTAIQYWSNQTMAIVTSINLAAGGSSDEIVVEDQNGNPLAPATVTWSTPVGEAAPTDLTVAAAPDGSGFNFTAGAAAPSEAVTVTATWTDPAGMAPSVTSGPLTINITAASSGGGSTAPTSLQFNEVSGS